jgi:hypothetical protein
MNGSYNNRLGPAVVFIFRHPVNVGTEMSLGPITLIVEQSVDYIYGFNSAHIFHRPMDSNFMCDAHFTLMAKSVAYPVYANIS